MRSLVWLSVSLFLLAACRPATATQTAVSLQPTALTQLPTPTLHQPAPLPTAPEPPTAVPTQAIRATPTTAPTETAVPATAAATAEPTVGPPAVIYGRTAEGAFFQGYAGAPITLIDYSDFL